MARASRLDSRFDTAIFAACIFLAIVAHGLPDKMREPIAATMRRTIVAPLVGLQHNAELSRAAWLAHESSTRVQDSVSLQAMRVVQLESENERLRRVLGLGGKLRWGFVPAEALHSGAVGDEYTLTLSAGANAGVRAFSPVVAPEGLVGMVQTVDPRMSIAIIWTHPDFRVSARAADRSAFGIAQAHQGSGADRYLLELRGVPVRNEIKKGTLIVSSGLGGVYPEGIPIGTVIDTLRSDGYARKYLLRPSVLPPDVLSVMILQPQRASGGVEPVWAATVAAADSLARASAAAESLSAARAAAAARPATDTTRVASGTAPNATVPGSAAAGAVTNPDSVAAAARARALRRARRDSIRADSIRRAAADSANRPAPVRTDSTRRDTARPVAPPPVTPPAPR
ncbi:MAG TPA: rod shape-determining protein MreC [Gemmatimonadaceae bacterium]|nr:rod shape-determining protein MreC [Gemmatimonadaceae bacterium]